MNHSPGDFSDPVPRVVHFCFGMTPDFGGRPFGLSHYLAVRSAWEVLRPEVMFLHCVHVPSGEWWDQARSLLRIHKVPRMDGIYGFPANHPAHRADIIRLAALLAMGGIYADLDVLFLKPLDHFLNAPFVAARESCSDGVPVGISNALMIAKADSHFARLCLEGHDPARSLWSGFRSQGRDEHYVEYSVRYPCLLAQLCPGLIQTLPSESFLWLNWEPRSLRMLFEENVQIPSNALALHLWESHSMDKYLSRLTPGGMISQETTFNRLARRFLPASSDASGTAIMVAEEQFNPGLVEMERICERADFVNDTHRPVNGFGNKITRRFQKLAKRARAEIFLPMRCQIEVLERRIARMEWGHGFPERMHDLPESDQESALPLVRLGGGDGSDAMLGRTLRTAGVNCFSYLIGTGSGAEPAAASWAVLQPQGRGAWISGSLRRAKSLAEWAQGTGRCCRSYYGGAALPEWVATLSHADMLFEPAVLVLAGTGKEYWQWKEVNFFKPRIVLVACNTVIPPNSTLTVPPDYPGHPSGLVWGASRGAFLQLARERGYSLREISADGQFLIFTLGDETKEVISMPDIIFPYTRTLYGQIISIDAGDAERIVMSEGLIDTLTGKCLEVDA